MHIHRIINTIFSSNTYVIHNDGGDAWLVDCGEFDAIVTYLSENRLNPKGVFLTHAHFDHICGLNLLYDAYPSVEVFCSSYAAEALYSSKMNLSKYHESPFELNQTCIVHSIDSQMSISIFENTPVLISETPGHNLGSLTFKIDKYLFTGDSYIPGLKIVTNLRGGDKQQAQDSLQLIKNLITNGTTLCPGHGNMLRQSKLIY